MRTQRDDDIKKSIPHCRPHVQVFFFLGFSPCRYVTNRDIFAATCTVTLISQNHEIILCSHFNQFLTYKCAIDVASTKCQYM